MSLARLSFIALILGLSGVAGCGETKSQQTTVSQAQSACAPKQAQIQVQTASMTRLCGCAEGGAAAIAPPNSLQCTITPGSQIVFHFPEQTTLHQIVSLSSPAAFAPSPLRAPTHTAQFDRAGTFPFQDAINSALNGSIIVR